MKDIPAKTLHRIDGPYPAELNPSRLVAHCSCGWVIAADDEAAILGEIDAHLEKAESE